MVSQAEVDVRVSIAEVSHFDKMPITKETAVWGLESIDLHFSKFSQKI